MMYAVVRPTPGISENTTLPQDAKEGCSEFELGVAAFEMIQEEFQPDQRWGLKLSQVFRVSYEARILCAHCQRDAACGNKSTRAARGATRASRRSTPGALTGPLLPAAKSSRRQKCPPLTPGGRAGEGHALRPAPSRGAGSAARARVRPGAGRARAQG